METETQTLVVTPEEWAEINRITAQGDGPGIEPLTESLFAYLKSNGIEGDPILISSIVMVDS